MKIVVTGGLGFIGSHTVVELQNIGHEVVIIDNCSNSSKEVLKGIAAITGKTPELEEFDLREKSKVQDFFKRHTDVQGLIHFAASKAVGESVKNPLLYYENNIGTLVYILQELIKKDQASLTLLSGAILFILSDSMIALNKFYEAQSIYPAAIMITYIIAQFLIFRYMIRSTEK